MSEDQPSPTADEPEAAQTIIICGWSTQAQRMVEDLSSHAPSIAFVVINAEESLESRLGTSGQGLTHICGDPTHTEVLRKAGVADARAVLVVADQSYGAVSHTLDARSLLSVLAVREISSSVPLIAEFSHQKNVELARSAGVDQWVLADEFSGVMLSQSLQSSGLSKLFMQLFETAAGSALREQAVPPSLVDAHFSDATAHTVEMGLGALAGVRRGDDIHLPPREDIILDSDDILLVMYRLR